MPSVSIRQYFWFLPVALFAVFGCGDEPDNDQTTVDAPPVISTDSTDSYAFLESRALNGDRSERAVAIKVLLNAKSVLALDILSKSYDREPDRFLRRALIDGLTGFNQPDVRPDARTLAQRALKDDDLIVQVVAARALTLTASPGSEKEDGLKELKRRSKEDESNPEPSDLAKKYLREIDSPVAE
ncbi:MAG: hypothetical protein ABIH86_05180 [Planctomycetota bacterium]